MSLEPGKRTTGLVFGESPLCIYRQSPWAVAIQQSRSKNSFVHLAYNKNRTRETSFVKKGRKYCNNNAIVLRESSLHVAASAGHQLPGVRGRNRPFLNVNLSNQLSERCIVTTPLINRDGHHEFPGAPSRPAEQAAGLRPGGQRAFVRSQLRPVSKRTDSTPSIPRDDHHR